MGVNLTGPVARPVIAPVAHAITPHAPRARFMVVRAHSVVLGAPSARSQKQLVAVRHRKPKPDASWMEDLRKYCKELSISAGARTAPPPPRQGLEAGPAALALG